MATETSVSSDSSSSTDSCVKIFESRLRPPKTRQQLLLNPSPVVTTLYKFPSLEPLQFKQYDAKFLHLPLRRDLLHRAVVYEGNSHRLGRAKTKWRGEIVASKRKLRPQKGTGRARLGNRSSPMLRGGAKAHGPKPRDFSTDLPRKIYDLAFRTALSHRYRKGELIVIGEAIQPDHAKTRYMRQIMLLNKWGAGNGKTLFITMTRRNNLWCGLGMLGHHGRCMKVEDVDVKDLLEMGRIVIEQHALEWLGAKHGIEFPQRTPKKGKNAASEIEQVEVEAESVDAVSAVATATEVEAAAEGSPAAQVEEVDASSTEPAAESSPETPAEKASPTAS
ncbi:hypothetical protein H072_3551 [Dactylellina haptotyla CBS 200.50]|uniref:Large ribosomal subunit protein uL4m n=1 Tax=Dactylellina haptotyla (strain CBS 200.50) TaxID=1284197 RepID=S8AMS2_DACHA|nr:hypothetical protein H072_3551 [Dactylellina haptotyla CBS 200.50]